MMKKPIILNALIWSAIAISTASSSNAQANVATLSGVARVVDGDGLAFGDVEVRLQGIAAPEFDDIGGQESYLALRSLAENRKVNCVLDGTTANRRPVGVCYVGDVELGKSQVRSGMARDCPRYSIGRYADDEAWAREHGRDLSEQYQLPGYC